MIFHLSFHYLSFCSNSRISLIAVQDIHTILFATKINVYSSFPVITVGNVGILYYLHINSSNQFSFRVSPKFSNHFNWHWSHTEFMKRICWRPSTDWLKRNDVNFLFREEKNDFDKKGTSSGDWTWDLLWSTMMPSWLS